MAEWRFYIETFGCKVNQHESQALREVWQKLGGEESGNPSEADYICINSCAITEKAERDARNAVYRLRKLAPESKIILTGCSARLYANDPQKSEILERLDWCVPQQNKAVLFAGPWRTDTGNAHVPSQYFLSSYNRSRPVVKVQDGCRQNCAFCIVPSMRGAPVSRRFEDILRECGNLIEAGFAEIVLSGINLRQYSCEGNFWTMLQKLDYVLANEFGRIVRLRLSSLEPTMLNSQALETLAASRLIARHIHVSLQHASPVILEAMGRGDTRPEKILHFFEQLARIWPVAGVGADILVGFPGEQERDMEILSGFIENSCLTYAHVFPYSSRPGTRAADLPNQVPHLEKVQRAAAIRKQIGKRHEKFIHEIARMERFELVLDRPEQGEPFWRGINEYYVPCFMAPGAVARGLIRVRPLKIMEKGILTEPV